jgi:hypothetical protein
MPKRHNKRRLRGGGFFEGLQQSFSNFGNSVKSGTSDMWNKTKKATSSLQPSSTSSYQPSSSMSSSYQPSSSMSSSYQPSSSMSSSMSSPMSSSYQPSSNGSYGGSRRRTKRRMRGGYRDNISLTNIASTGAPFSGSTARAHNWVGGRRRKRRTRRTRTRSRRH